MKKLELELRGKFDKKDYKDLLKFLDRNGEFIREFKRFQMIYFNVKDERLEDHKNVKCDLRIRIENGKSSLVFKYGNWHDASGREEFDIPLQNNKVDDMVKILKYLEKDYGKIMIQETKVFKYKDAEWAIVEVPVDGNKDIYYWEVEREVKKSDELKEKNKLEGMISKLNLKSFRDDEFIEFCKDLNKIKGRMFDFRGNFNWSEIKEKFEDYLF
jgi:hypothetical protein